MLVRQFAGRGLLALGLAFAASAVSAELPKDPESMRAEIKSAIEARDYDRFKDLVLWKDVGKIKKRVVAFQIRRGLGREIESITLEDFDQSALDYLTEDGRHKLNMPVNKAVRIVYDEEAINDSGKKPTSVFLIGEHNNAYRIGVVVRNFEDDDDD